MLLTITTTHQPATDLGYLLHKHPGRAQTVDLSFGQAHIFYPEATSLRCTAALLLDVDPVTLVRGKGESEGPLDQYVNDRPYTASSLLSVALAQVFGTAMGGRSRERPELAQRPIPLEARVAVLPCWDGEELVRIISGITASAPKTMFSGQLACFGICWESVEKRGRVSSLRGRRGGISLRLRE